MWTRLEIRWAVVVHAFNPSTWEAEAGGFLSSRPTWSTSEFQDSQGYTEKHCLKKKKKKKKRILEIKLEVLFSGIKYIFY
jgi:hypothetical protein